MNKINWKVRFSKKNLSFVIRFVGALLIPVLAYLGINWVDLNTWESLISMLTQFITNPYLVGLTVINAINMIPDNTSTGLSDSSLALTYEKPNDK